MADWLARVQCRWLGHIPVSRQIVYGPDQPSIVSSVCVQQIDCQRCGAPLGQTTTPHEYGEWKYRREQNCAQMRQCRVCHQEETRTQHVFDQPPAPDRTGCVLFQVCSRCGQRKKYGERHDWETLQTLTETYRCSESLIAIERCRRCGAQRRNSLESWLT